MTTNEKEALLRYFEFGLLNLCDKVGMSIDTNNIDVLYEQAYLLLIDIDDTLESHRLMSDKTYP